MKVGTRVVFSIFIVIILVICAAIIISALGLIPEAYAVNLFNSFTNGTYKYLWAAVAAVLFIAGVCLLFFRSGQSEPEMVELTSSTEGSVKIYVSAIEELETRYLAEITGIIVQKIKVKPVSAGVIKLVLNICVRPEVEIPSTTEQISKGSVEYIGKYSGLTVSAVDIKIMPIKNTSSK